MYKRITLLALVLVILVAAPQFEAMPTGIGSAADGGCSCHAGASPDTNVIVTGLPGTFNASETYSFTVTVQNDVMELYNGGVIEEDGTGWNGRAGGFRILSTGGMVSTVNESLSHEMDGGLTHTTEGNTVRTWDFEWVAPADDSKVVEFTVYGNAVNGGAGAGGDYWNQADLSIPGLNADATGPTARTLVVLLTAIGLSLGMVLLGVLWVFYTRSPQTFTISKFWSYLKPWLTTTDHKEVGILYFLFGFTSSLSVEC